MDWSCQAEYTLEVDKYEHSKNVTRDASEMKIPVDIRISMLKDHGHSWHSIREATKQANIGRRLRGLTRQRCGIKQIRFDEKMETVVRFIKKPFQKRENKVKIVTTTLSSQNISAKALKARSMSLETSVSTLTISQRLEENESTTKLTQKKSKSLLCNCVEVNN